MRELKAICNSVKAKHNVEWFKDLEAELEHEINGNTYIKSYYLNKCESNSDYGMHGFVVAIVSFILACFAIMADQAGKSTVVIIIAALYVLIIGIYGVYIMYLAEKYRKIRIILDNI